MSCVTAAMEARSSCPSADQQSSASSEAHRSPLSTGANDRPFSISHAHLALRVGHPDESLGPGRASGPRVGTIRRGAVIEAVEWVLALSQTVTSESTESWRPPLTSPSVQPSRSSLRYPPHQASRET
jgi:hypothetical protein